MRSQTQRDADRKYYERHREEKLRKKHEYYLKNKDKQKEWTKRYRSKPEVKKRLNAKRRQKYAKNPHKTLERNRRYRQRKPPAVVAAKKRWKKRWKATHRDKINRDQVERRKFGTAWRKQQRENQHYEQPLKAHERKAKPNERCAAGHKLTVWPCRLCKLRKSKAHPG